MNRYLSTVASLLFLGLMNRPELRAAAPLRQLQQATLVWVLEFKKRKLKLQGRPLVLVGNDNIHTCAFQFYLQLPLEFLLLYRVHGASSPSGFAFPGCFSFSCVFFYARCAKCFCVGVCGTGYFAVEVEVVEGLKFKFK